jgi:hypothetical protein
MWLLYFEASKLSYEDLKPPLENLPQKVTKFYEAKQIFLQPADKNFIDQYSDVESLDYLPKIKKWIAENKNLLDILPGLQHTKSTKLTAAESMFTADFNDGVLVDERNKNLEIIVSMINSRIDLSGQTGFKNEWTIMINEYLAKRLILVQQHLPSVLATIVVRFSL